VQGRSCGAQLGGCGLLWICFARGGELSCRSCGGGDAASLLLLLLLMMQRRRGRAADFGEVN
jgi:hypothetical protein